MLVGVREPTVAGDHAAPSHRRTTRLSVVTDGSRSPGTNQSVASQWPNPSPPLATDQARFTDRDGLIPELASLAWSRPAVETVRDPVEVTWSNASATGA